MTETKNVIISFSEKSKSTSGQVQQFRRAEQKSIIAEVKKLPDDAAVRIAGNDLPAEMVALIFDRIEHGHVIEVMRHYQEATYEIKHTKTYLRTALYNSVFEMEARIDNEVRKDMGY